MNDLTAARQARIETTLNTQMRVNGIFGTRKHHVHILLEKGYRVYVDHKGRRKFENPEGNFFYEKDLTKVAFDYAETLLA